MTTYVIEPVRLYLFVDFGWKSYGTATGGTVEGASSIFSSLFTELRTQHEQRELDC